MQTTQLCPPAIREVIARARLLIEPALADGAQALELGAETAEVLGALTEDAELAQAALVKPAMGPAGLSVERLAALAGDTAAQTALALIKVEELWVPWAGEDLDPRQAEALRKMLLALASDPRLIMARLAERLVALRHARDLPAEEQQRLALEARNILAPLASRLGIWQLKWELEDLAFRYLEPEAYHRLAAALNERRADRERYIAQVCQTLSAHLARAGIEAQVYGRPKHMYSIHRKMQRKHLQLEQLFDIRAVRVVVQTVRDCYAALGVVHGLWRYIPGEFDDYIATPKSNGYRSIHTAVVGPQGRNVEVQIRTPAMHEHAELGVAAHWAYKEGVAPRKGSGSDALYQRKIEWARRLLEPARRGDADRDFLERMRKDLFEDRVYVLTPRGEVVDLPRGATPLDFAYAVHTSLGHRCRGAKVNGRIVPLTHRLTHSSLVEIITGKEESPSRDWLVPEQGYLVTGRARTKVRAWFRKQDAGDNRAAGRVIAERELSRTGLRPEQLGVLAHELGAKDSDDLYQLLGEGEITGAQLARAAEKLAPSPAQSQPAQVRPAHRGAKTVHRSPVSIEGVSDLPVTLARCCAPLRPQAITGYMTTSRGLLVHRSDCRALARMREMRPDRVFTVQWTQETADLSVEISVQAHDRAGLVRDVSDVLAQERLSIQAMTTTTDREASTAHVLVTVPVDDLEQLERVLRRLQSVPDVTVARRAR